MSFLTNANNSSTSQQLAGFGVSNPTQPPLQQHAVSLNWSPVSSTQGYYVYRGGDTGGPYTKISDLQPATAYVDSTVTSGQSYYYVVTSLSASSVESGYSNEAQAVIPTP
jgi:fibronectin type 3 domain-containing protein